MTAPTLLSRRRALQLGAAWLAGTAGLSLLPRPLGASRSPRIVIVGAGLSGLSAALGLRKRGFDPLVLEARDRPGGRVRTARAPLSSGLHADLGPWRIATEHRDTRRWAEELGLGLEPIDVSDDELIYILRGRRFSARQAKQQPDLFPYELTPGERRLGPAGLWERCFGPYSNRDLDPFASRWPDDLAAMDDLSLGSFFRRCGLSPGGFDLVADAIHIRPFLHTAFLNNLREELHGFYGGFLAVDGGNDLIPQRMADRLGDAVRYGCAVERIDHGGERPAVEYACDGRPGRLVADRLIVTVPFSVLRQIEITPDFSPPKHRAIHELNYEGATKVLIETRDPAWKAFQSGEIREIRTDLPMQLVRLHRHPRQSDRGLVVAYMMGRVPEVEGLSAHGLERYAVEQMRDAELGPMAEPVAAVSIRWSEEPWAQGAYPVYLPGQETALQPHIAPPEGRVHFAGDHTSMAPGWMLGALRSGERVAREVAAALRADPQAQRKSPRQEVRR